MAAETTSGDGGLAAFSVAREGDTATLLVVGEIDLSNADTLLAQLRELIDGAPTVHVDLGQAQYLDSSGLRSLSNAVKYASSRDRECRVVRAGHIIRRVIETAGLVDVLGLEPN